MSLSSKKHLADFDEILILLQKKNRMYDIPLNRIKYALTIIVHEQTNVTGIQRTYKLHSFKQKKKMEDLSLFANRRDIKFKDN